MRNSFDIKNWAYIAKSQVDYLLELIGTSFFNKESDIYTQVYNYLNYRWKYISVNNWFLYDENKTQIAFNIGLKPYKIEKFLF